MFIEIIKSVIFGIVEGITEWLPISSTGHMILLDEFIKIKFLVFYTIMKLKHMQFIHFSSTFLLYFL